MGGGGISHQFVYIFEGNLQKKESCVNLLENSAKEKFYNNLCIVNNYYFYSKNIGTTIPLQSLIFLTVTGMSTKGPVVSLLNYIMTFTIIFYFKKKTQEFLFLIFLVLYLQKGHLPLKSVVRLVIFLLLKAIYSPNNMVPLQNDLCSFLYCLVDFVGGIARRDRPFQLSILYS